MTEQLGTDLGKWLWKKEVIEEGQIDEVRFAFEIVCSEFLEILTILGYGIVTNQIIITFLYLILFHILRSAFQGYHAKTIWKCFLLTVSAYFGCMIVYKHMTEIAILLFLIVSMLLQLSYCKLHKDIKALILSISLMCIGTFIYILYDPIFLKLIAVVELLVSVSILPERRVYEKRMHWYDG